MQDLTIHDLDDATVYRLREAADRNGRTLEDEARTLLTAGAAGATKRPDNMADRIRARVDRVGSIELPVVREAGIREPPDFS